MKITKSQLRKFIKEEISCIRESGPSGAAHSITNKGYAEAHETESSRSPLGSDVQEFAGGEVAEVIDDITDAIQMLETEDDITGTLFHVINRLEEAKSRLQELAPEGKQQTRYV